MMKFDEKVLEQVVVMDESGKVDLEASCAQCPYCAECEKPILTMLARSGSPQWKMTCKTRRRSRRLLFLG